MSIERVKEYFDHVGLLDRVKEFTASSFTVEDAALAVGCKPAHIAKTMSFLLGDIPILIVAAGDGKIDNKKYKGTFHQKAKMIPFEEVEHYIGHAPGGVCPFAIDDSIEVYLDVSLKRFETVYPAAGSDHSAVALSPDELKKHSGSMGWIDVCKGWQEETAS